MNPISKNTSPQHSDDVIPGLEKACTTQAMSVLTSLLECSNDLIAAVDANLHFIVLNAPFRHEFELVYGKTVQLGERLDEVLADISEDCERAVTLCRRALAGESFRVIENFGDEELLRKSYELAFNPIFDTDHRPILVAVVMRDRTLERVSERHFGALLDATPDATIVMRTDGTIDLANVHAERMFGYDRHQFSLMKIEQLIPKRFRTRHIAYRNQFARKPAARPMGSGRVDLLGLRADGSEFPVEISLSPLNIDGEHLVVAAIRDMTLRQRAEDQLRELTASLEKRVAERTSALEQANRDNRITFEQAAVGIAHLAPSGRWLRVNQKLCDILGYSSEEMQSLTFQDITHPDDLAADLSLMADALASTTASYEIEKRYLRKDGEIVWTNLSVSLVRDNHGAPQYFICIIQDISERKQAEMLRKESKQALELAIEATGLGLFDYFPQSGKLVWTAETKRHFGLSPQADVSHEVFLKGLHPGDRKRAESEVRKVLLPNSGGRYHIVYRTLGIEDKLERWIEARGRVIFDDEGKAYRLVGSTLDISAGKKAEEQIRQLALHDPLTGLPNRGLLFEYADHVFGRSRRTGHHCGILFVDLDRFKPINDNHGHEVGDAVLQEVARRLVKSTREEDFVFRLGGDEFMVLLPEIENAANATEVANHILACVNAPYHVDSLEIALSASVGISIFPQDGEDIDTLINHADSAMYQAKQEGRNNVQYYSKELAARSQMQSVIEEQLKVALNHNTFELYYQPVIDTMTSDLIGVEALLRWPHDKIGPDRFIPIAEATGLINRVGDWVLAEACRQHKLWQSHGLPIVPIAINVSAVQFRQKDFAERFAQMIRNCSVDISVLQIEVTETALMENFDHAADVLVRLRALGVKIALDDFGTGYSSLNYLSRLPINKIKVDKSFVQRIDFDTASRAITEAVIALGRTLNLEVVAEGIESEESLNYLRHHGCNQAQGYFVSKPVRAASFESWYHQYREAREL